MSGAARCGGLAALALAAAATTPAAAHVTISPPSSRPADLQRYRLLVPNEDTTRPTSGVDLKLPEGVDFVLVDDQPGWTSRLIRVDGRPSQIRWTGGDVKPDHYAELSFIARNPVREGRVDFKAIQTYAGGKVARWIGSAGSDHPSPMVTLSETATPQDIVSTHGEKLPMAAPAGAAAPAAPVAPAPRIVQRSGASTGLAVSALVVGALGLATGAAALITTRRRRDTT